MILMIDNYDSFTFNLVQYLRGMGARVEVRRNDELSVEQAIGLEPAGLVVSPGPCTPNEAGICVDLIRAAAGRIPLFGVCLGMQCIGQAYGARVVHAQRVMHGKVSEIGHDGEGVFANIKSPMKATRYHSLALERTSLPDCLQVTATDEEGEIMGVRHRTCVVEGVQFHPESILTTAGKRIVRNFLRLAQGEGSRE